MFTKKKDPQWRFSQEPKGKPDSKDLLTFPAPGTYDTSTIINPRHSN
jgi:hypothetical protein